MKEPATRTDVVSEMEPSIEVLPNTRAQDAMKEIVATLRDRATEPQACRSVSLAHPRRTAGKSSSAHTRKPANADDIAGWLGAQMVRVMWRPTRLIWQLPMIAATSDWKAANATRARLAALARQVTADGGGRARPTAR